MKRLVVMSLFVLSSLAAAAEPLPANTWVRVGDCPGDAEGREVPPGRAAAWCYDSGARLFLRYGGYTPRFSNAMDAFDPATGKWKRLFAEDENYPTNRPGGGCCWAMQYDPGRKLVWLGAGLANGYAGSQGIWSYDPASARFECYSPTLPPGVTRGCFDPVNGVFVAQPWPKSNGQGEGSTMVFTVADRQWQAVRTSPSPQPLWGGFIFPMTFDAGLGRVVAIAGEKGPTNEVWTFDGAAKRWEQMATTNGPSFRTRSAIAYDPDNKIILLHGVHPGRGRPDSDSLNDTWILDTAAKTWKEIRTPGPTVLKGDKGHVETVYRQALGYDLTLKRFTLADPDLGVWVFRYDPGAEPGKENVSGGFAPAVGLAAANPPPDGATNACREVFRKLPSPLNPRLLEMGDNTIMPLGGGSMPGSEVGWCWDPDNGVFVKYGGCGNWSSPFWSQYGNNLIYYDPGVERWYTRRVGDVSGAVRPGNGCTRSVLHDSGRKVLWFFGGASSGPACPRPSPPVGTFAYDMRTDRFADVPGDIKAGMGGNGCMMEEDLDHQVAICPSTNKVHVFDMKTASWQVKAVGGFSGLSSVYSRMAYIRSKKVFMVLSATGGEGVDCVNRTMAYDPVAGTWTDLAPKGQPPSRGCKYGLVYDSKNDVAILMGGGTGWNKGWRNDMWAYLVKENRWEKLSPVLAGGAKQLPAFTDNMPSGFDERHNAVIFTEGNSPWAYRYRK